MPSRNFPEAVNLAALGAASAGLGSVLVGGNIGTAPEPGIYMALVGLWFGLVIAFAVWRWGPSTKPAAVTAGLITWFGWQAAVNLALQLDTQWLSTSGLGDGKIYIAGVAAGAIGALITWAGAAVAVPHLRQPATAAAITLTGAVFGLLLPATNAYENSIVLLLPWQTAVAAVIGLHLAPVPALGAKPS